ncbi:FAS1 domain-containing protein [Chytriomyces sp. MP71]|nr:FAS1 domain-containing protein [Chytriomyces sp. MP71]
MVRNALAVKSVTLGTTWQVSKLATALRSDTLNLPATTAAKASFGGGKKGRGAVEALGEAVSSWLWVSNVNQESTRNFACEMLDNGGSEAEDREAHADGDRNDLFNNLAPPSTVELPTFAYLMLVAQVATAQQSLVATLVGMNNTNTLISLVKSVPAIMTALANFNGTLFAPTDSALAATVAAGFNASDLTAVANVLKYHVVPVNFPTSSFKAGSTAFLATLQGNEVKAVFSANGITINTAKVMTSTPYNGGIIHTIDATLLPPANIVTVAQKAGLNLLLATATQVGLAATIAGLTNVTILAPTDAAFTAAAAAASALSPAQIKAVLLYHVIPGIVHSTDIMVAKNLPNVPTLLTGQTLAVSSNGTAVQVKGFASSANVVTADVFADHVLVHVIDAVLIPNVAAITAGNSTATASAMGSAMPPASKAATGAASPLMGTTTGAAKLVGGVVSAMLASLLFA